MSIAKQLRPDLRAMIDIPLPSAAEMMKKLANVGDSKFLVKHFHPKMTTHLADKKLETRKIVALIVLARLEYLSDCEKHHTKHIKKAQTMDLTKYIKTFITDETLYADAIEIYKKIVE